MPNRTLICLGVAATLLSGCASMTSRDSSPPDRDAPVVGAPAEAEAADEAPPAEALPSGRREAPAAPSDEAAAAEAELAVAGLAGDEDDDGETDPGPPDFSDRTHDGKVVMFGNLHAHSRLSGDVRETGDEFSPRAAWTYARSHGIDFLALAEHHKASDAPGPPLALTDDQFQDDLVQVAFDFNRDHPGFVAVPALEWGNTSTGNHLTIVGPDSLPPDDIQNREYDELLDWAADHAQFLQLNHPNSWRGSNRDREVGNYGQALYASDDEFVAAINRTKPVVTIITTVRGGHIGGDHARSEAKTHRDMQWENFYQRFLNLGMRVSPVADQDTHWRNFGTVTAARAAVWADAATFDGLMGGFRANRTYSTEDDELVVVLQARYQGETFWMGDTVTLAADEDDVELVVKVWQGAGSDGDPIDEGPYTVVFKSDADGVGGRAAAPIEQMTIEALASGEEAVVPHLAASGEYLYVEVTEQNGQDNAVGDGDDVFRNGTDEREMDGLRDELDDQAWTAAIWFKGPPPEPMLAPARFVSSRGSNLFHTTECFAVERMGRSERILTAEAPEAREPHSCVESHD